MCVRFATVLLLFLPLSAGAQTSADDGVRAFVQGDYKAAARILSPLAEASADPDPSAQFFMGLMYAAGKGVRTDTMRACALFAAAAKPSNPFMEQASAVAMLMEQTGGGGGLCARGPAMAPRPASFTLGPDYSLDVMPYGFVVHYRGTERTEPITTLPGSLSLPVRYTALDVTRPVTTRRHFVEQFTWWQSPVGGSTWMLGWILGEIVDGGYVPILAEANVASTTDSRPPASLDLERVVRVRLNAQGEAEWLILGGPNPRSAVIPWRAGK